MFLYSLPWTFMTPLITELQTTAPPLWHCWGQYLTYNSLCAAAGMVGMWKEYGREAYTRTKQASWAVLLPVQDGAKGRHAHWRGPSLQWISEAAVLFNINNCTGTKSTNAEKLCKQFTVCNHKNNNPKTPDPTAKNRKDTKTSYIFFFFKCPSHVWAKNPKQRRVLVFSNQIQTHK